MNLNLIRIAAVATTVIVGWSADAAQEYQIRLQQPGKVGSKHRFYGIGAQTDRATITSGGKLIQSTENAFTVELTADVTELETETRGGPDDDEVFGTRIRRRVGESWSLDADAVTAFLKEIDAQAPREGISGKTTLLKVEDNHLFISASMIVRQFVMPLPSGFKCDAGEFRAEFSGRFPVGPSNSGLDGTQSLVILMTGKRPPTDGQAEVTMEIHSEASSRYNISGVR